MTTVMRILFDQGMPAPLRPELPTHIVSTAHEMSWSKLSNGDLLRAAESAFDLLVSTDQSLQYQQNLTGRRLAILVLPTTSWPIIRQFAGVVAKAINLMKEGDYLHLPFAKSDQQPEDMHD